MMDSHTVGLDLGGGDIINRISGPPLLMFLYDFFKTSKLFGDILHSFSYILIGIKKIVVIKGHHLLVCFRHQPPSGRP